MAVLAAGIGGPMVSTPEQGGEFPIWQRRWRQMNGARRFATVTVVVAADGANGFALVSTLVAGAANVRPMRSL